MVIAGQGTPALELLQQDAHIDRVFVPVGGGGLAAGVAVLIATDAADQSDRGGGGRFCLKAALDAGHPVDLPRVGLFAEGVAVKRIGDETFRLCRSIWTISSPSIAMLSARDEGSVRRCAGGGGAFRRAGAGGDEKYIAQHNIRGERLAHILSGANVNFHGTCPSAASSGNSAKHCWR